MVLSDRCANGWSASKPQWLSLDSELSCKACGEGAEAGLEAIGHCQNQGVNSKARSFSAGRAALQACDGYEAPEL